MRFMKRGAFGRRGCAGGRSFHAKPQVKGQVKGQVKAQVSMEFLILLTLTFIITIPLIMFFFKESQSASKEINFEQIGRIARRIVSAADVVYAFGEPSSVTVKVYMPAGVANVSINANEIVFFVNSEGNTVSIVDVFSMNATGSLSASQGIHNIRVTAANNSVVISEFSE